MRARLTEAWHGVGDWFAWLRGRAVPTRRAERVLRIRDSDMMGRSAVAVVIACVQVPAFAQIATPRTASKAVEAAGPDALAYLWALSIIAAGVLMVCSYVARDRSNKAFLEILAIIPVTIGSLVYLGAIVETAGTVGAYWLLAISSALAINCAGRAVLLVRQIWHVKRGDLL